MSTEQLTSRIAAVRSAIGDLASGLSDIASSLEPDELFQLAGELQGLLNAVDGAQLVAIAHAASHETRLTDRGPTQVHQPVGFVDAMAGSEVSLLTGTGQWAAARRVGLAARSAERFPRLLAMIVAGDLPSATVQKVVTTCDGLDVTACAAVEAVLVERLADLDPSRVTGVTRRLASQVAADQLAAAERKGRRDRCVEVSPGPDGSTQWWALLPADRSAAAWAAVRSLADTYTVEDPSLTVDQARADALLDLLLSNVDVTAKVTIGIPVVTGAEGEAARDAAVAAREAEEGWAAGGGQPVGLGGRGLGSAFSVSAALYGCEVAGVGWIGADTVGALLETVPLEVGRALLDTRTGTTVETVTSAYRPTRAVTGFVTLRDGTCRMWGCSRPAEACDVDHARPWPAGPTSPGNLAGLCRRHHRLKQLRRWQYRLDPDGTVTWTSPTGRRRVTLPEHALPPPTPAPRPPSQPAAVAPPPF